MATYDSFGNVINNTGGPNVPPAGGYDFTGVTPTDYSQAYANSTYLPGLGYMPNSRIQSDARGAWIGAGAGGGDASQLQYGAPTGPDYGQAPAQAPMQSPAQAGGGFGGGAPGLQSYQQNPYLTQMGEGLRNQFTGFMNDGLAANRGAAVASGGVGGSRQGIAEARTMTDAGKGFDSALANLYGNDYQQQMGRNLQKYQGDQSYNLGLGGLDLQGRGQDMSFYTAQRGQDQTGAALGGSLYNLGMQGPWNTLNSANGLASPYTNNGTQTTSGTSGGGAMGAFGGALGAAQLGKNFGWWGN